MSDTMPKQMPNPNDAPREVANAANPRGYAAHRKTHPMLIIAAGAVTVFAAVGVGVMTGVIPNAHSLSSTKTESSMPSVPTAMNASAFNGSAGSAADIASPESAAQAAKTNALDVKPDVKSGIKPVENKAIGQPLAKSSAAAAPHHATAAKANHPAGNTATTVASANTNTHASPSSANERAPTPVYAQNGAASNSSAAPEPVICRTCGTIESVNAIAKQGEGSGAGAVLGGVLGGVIGHQVGNGRGKDLATVAGAVGGAVLGNSVEKNVKTAKNYDVRVRMEDGTVQTIRYETEPGMRLGDKVRVENGRILR